GLFGSIFPVGGMIGPIFGGPIVSYWSWRGIFLVNVPIGLAVIVLAYRYIPASRISARRGRGRLDLPGLVLMGIGIVCGMLAAAYLGEAGASPTSARFVIPTIASIVALVLFFRHI